MLARNGAGPAPVGTEDEAQKGFRFDGEPSSPIIRQDPAIRAELRGSDVCAALGLTARSPSPVLSLCRQLIASGHPDRPLEARRGQTLCLRVRSIREAAELEINSKGTSFIKAAVRAQACPCAQSLEACHDHPQKIARRRVRDAAAGRVSQQRSIYND
jgi:hypothetical protein